MSRTLTTQSTPDFTADRYWGQGGRYIVVDGKRIPAPAEPAAEPAPVEAPSTDRPELVEGPAKKGK